MNAVFGQSFEWWPGFWQVWHNEAPKGMCGSYGCCAGGTQGPLYSAILTARTAARTRTGELFVHFDHVPENSGPASTVCTTTSTQASTSTGPVGYDGKSLQRFTTVTLCSSFASVQLRRVAASPTARALLPVSRRSGHSLSLGQFRMAGEMTRCREPAWVLCSRHRCD